MMTEFVNQSEHSDRPCQPQTEFEAVERDDQQHEDAEADADLYGESEDSHPFRG